MTSFLQASWSDTVSVPASSTRPARQVVTQWCCSDSSRFIFFLHTFYIFVTGHFIDHSQLPGLQGRMSWLYIRALIKAQKYQNIWSVRQRQLKVKSHSNVTQVLFKWFVCPTLISIPLDLKSQIFFSWKGE